jgi:hypothetical protein
MVIHVVYPQDRTRLIGRLALVLSRISPYEGAAGQVAERSKARAWKVRIRQKRIVGSNPTLSAIDISLK